MLVIGGGNSACDINVEAAKYAETTHCSMRRGYWFLPRTICGVPLGILANPSHFVVEITRPWMPLWMQRTLIKLSLFFIIGSYESYGLQKPDHKIFEQHPTINTEILNYLKLGKISPHPGIFSPNDSIQTSKG